MLIKHISIILGSDKNMYIIYFIVLFTRIEVRGGGGDFYIMAEDLWFK